MNAITHDRTDRDRALWITGPGRAELRPVAVAAADAASLAIRALVSGISRGTESLIFQGKVPQSEWRRMRCPFQEGDFPFPVKYGYAMAGEVTGGPAERLGQRILCLHPHQSLFTVPVEAAIPIPTDVSTERAVLGPQMETALNATWDAAPCMGDRIAVVGGGVIGCLTGYLCAQMPGVSVTLIDTNLDRRAVAVHLGMGFATPDDDSFAGECDLVFHASGRADGLALALSLAGFEATIIELSWYGADMVPVSLGGAFHSRRLTLRSSQVGAVAPARRARWDMARRLRLALTLCADPRLDILLAEETPFADLPDRLPAILGQQGALCHLVRYT